MGRVVGGFPEVVCSDVPPGWSRQIRAPGLGLRLQARTRDPVFSLVRAAGRCGWVRPTATGRQTGAPRGLSGSCVGRRRNGVRGLGAREVTVTCRAGGIWRLTGTEAWAELELTRTPKAFAHSLGWLALGEVKIWCGSWPLPTTAALVWPHPCYSLVLQKARSGVGLSGPSAVKAGSVPRTGRPLGGINALFNRSRVHHQVSFHVDEPMGTLGQGGTGLLPKLPNCAGHALGTSY